MAFPNPIEGAVGGWFFHTHTQHANYANIDYIWTFRISFASGFIGRWKSQFASSSSGPPPGNPTGPLTNLEVFYRIYHRWSETPLAGNLLDNQAEFNIIGSLAGVPLARLDVGQVWRWAMTFRCSTWTGTDFLYDGFSKLYLNDVLVSEGTSLRIPQRFTAENQALTYQLHIFGDTDRVWARTQPIVLPTDSTGAMIGDPPADLLFFDDFNDGLYPNWTAVGGFYTGAPPNAMSMVGGDGGWGLTSFCLPPSVASPCTSGVGYVGDAVLTRTAAYPPVGEPVTVEARISQLPIEVAVGEADRSGIYTPTPPASPTTPGHDLYYARPGTIDKKIPNPTIKTALFGE